MTGLLLMALWAVFSVMVVYVLKALCILRKSQEWLSRPIDSRGELEPLSGSTKGKTPTDELDDAYCPIFPVASSNEDD